MGSVVDIDPDQYNRLIKDRAEFSVWTLEDEELSAEDKAKNFDEHAVLT